MDTYKTTRVMEFPGVVARIHIPDLTPDERTRRMNAIQNAASALLRKGDLPSNTVKNPQ